jgi:Kef-type K+ transport system membrane component KefB
MVKNKYVLAYAPLVGLPALLLWAILQQGKTLTAAGPAAAQIQSNASLVTAPLDVFKLVVQVLVILLISRFAGMLFRKIRQPQVIGEMLAGILLGPSLLGWVAPTFSNALFPVGSLGYLNALSQMGLILFMFLIGVSLDPKELRGNGPAALLTSHASIAMPFCLGSATALVLYRHVSGASVSFVNFALFMGVAMSITAFPVLARILTERNLLRSRVGTLAIACAAVDDVTGWCILAYIVVLIRSGNGSMPAWVTIGGAVTYVLVMLLLVKPLLSRFDLHFRKKGRLTENSISLMIVLALLSALATERLGIHLVFGAFLMGAIMPKSRDLIETLQHKMESITVVVLLPLFFAFSGLRTNISSVKGELWLYTLLVIAAAITGKFGGSMLAARMAGLPWRDSASLGILMNTRGLMELVALNVGLDIGVISQTMFSIMVLMALVTTLMTSPLLEWIYPSRLMRMENAVEARVA